LVIGEERREKREEEEEEIVDHPRSAILYLLSLG
jgi:hypothetical protein